MANTSITAYDPTKYHTDEDVNTHKALPSVKWMGNASGNASYEIIPQTLIPTMGNTTSDRPFEAKNPTLFNLSKVPNNFYDRAESNGFTFNKISTTLECAVNLAVKHTGDNGMVIPASLIRSVGFEFRRNSTANSNWRVWNIGLEFKHYNDTSGTFAELYTPGWTYPKNDQAGYENRAFNGQQHFTAIRNLGPDYGLSRIIFNLRSNSSTGAQQPSAKLFHLKIGWDAGVDNRHKIIKPANQTWNEWAGERATGMRSFK